MARGIHFVVGPVTSGARHPVSDALAENGILMSNADRDCAGSHQARPDQYSAHLRRDDQQADVAAQYVLKNFKDKKIAILNDKAAYGKGLADAFKATLNAGGVTEVLDDS